MKRSIKDRYQVSSYPEYTFFASMFRDGEAKDDANQIIDIEQTIDVVLGMREIIKSAGVSALKSSESLMKAIEVHKANDSLVYLLFVLDQVIMSTESYDTPFDLHNPDEIMQLAKEWNNAGSSVDSNDLAAVLKKLKADHKDIMLGGLSIVDGIEGLERVVPALRLFQEGASIESIKAYRQSLRGGKRDYAISGLKIMGVNQLTEPHQGNSQNYDGIAGGFDVRGYNSNLKS